MKTAAAILLLAAPAFAEYLPGFSLYDHSSRADTVVLARVDAKGHATVLESVIGKLAPGAELELDPDRLQDSLAGKDRRAFLFLSEGRPVQYGGAAWVREDGVRVLPDNWGYGICWLVKFEPPAPEAFAKSVKIAVATAAEVNRVAKMPPGRERALAVSRLLTSAAADEAMRWYIFGGDSIGCYLDLTFRRPFEDWEIGEPRTWIEEVRTAIVAAIPELSAEEKEALLGQIRKLPPGTVRREHVVLLARGSVPAAAAEELSGLVPGAKDVRERFVLARVAYAADAAVTLETLAPWLEARDPAHRELLRRFLGSVPPRDGTEPLHALVVRASRELLEATADSAPDDLPGTDRNLAAGLVRILSQEGASSADLRLVLRFARSPYGSRIRADASLKRATGKDWPAADPRWDELLGE